MQHRFQGVTSTYVVHLAKLWHERFARERHGHTKFRGWTIVCPVAASGFTECDRTVYYPWIHRIHLSPHDVTSDVIIWTRSKVEVRTTYRRVTSPPPCEGGTNNI